MPVGLGRGGHNRAGYQHSALTAAHITLKRRGIDWRTLSDAECIRQYVALQEPVTCAYPGCTNVVGTVGRHLFKHCVAHGHHHLAGDNNPAKRSGVRSIIKTKALARGKFSDEHKAAMKKAFNDTKCHQKFWDAMPKEERERRGRLSSVIQKDYWDGLSPEEKEVRLKNWLKCAGPNKQEVKLQSILNDLFPGVYEFVGDFKMWVGGKNPDFVSVDGSKKVIEFYGTYWHPENSGEEDHRMDHFKKHGLDTLIVRDSELKNLPSLKTKLVQFHGSLR